MSNVNNHIKEHFDEIASEYDIYKRKNLYYYQYLKNLFKQLIFNPENKTILEVGCGTGDILYSLNPKKGVGIDISPDMIFIARKKYEHKENLSFYIGEAEKLSVEGKFDVVIMADVIEHLKDVDGAIFKVIGVLNPESQVIISSANPLWAPILYALEKLNLKMPEGQHEWISYGDLEKILKNNELEIAEKGYRLLIPVAIPLISRIINSTFYKLPLIRNLGLIQYIVAIPNKTKFGH